MSDARESDTREQAGYGRTAKSLHWLIVILLVLQYVVAWTMPEIHRNTQPETLINLHLSLGIAILAIALIRFAVRLLHPVPLLRQTMAAWQVRAAQLAHGLLYFLLFVLPLLGWASASSRGWHIAVFGLPVPSFLPADPARAGRLGDVHSFVAYLLLALIGLHLLAALYHHFWRRDRVLLRMMPGARA